MAESDVDDEFVVCN